MLGRRLSENEIYETHVLEQQIIELECHKVIFSVF